VVVSEVILRLIQSVRRLRYEFDFAFLFLGRNKRLPKSWVFHFNLSFVDGARRYFFSAFNRLVLVG